jgi:signal transduction histidine kinase
MTAVYSLMIATAPERIVSYVLYKLKAELADSRVFVAHMSHEMRTPLNNVAVSLDLLRHEAISNHASPETLGLIEDAVLSVNAATQILTGIPDYEKLGSGATTIDPCRSPQQRRLHLVKQAWATRLQ